MNLTPARIAVLRAARDGHLRSARTTHRLRWTIDTPDGPTPVPTPTIGVLYRSRLIEVIARNDTQSWWGLTRLGADTLEGTA